MFIVPITRLQPMEPLFETGAAQAASGSSAVAPFADVLKSAVEEMRQAQEASSRDAYDLALGRTDNLVEVMLNSQRMAASVEMTTQLTSRAVSVYKEIMQMQV